MSWSDYKKEISSILGDEVKRLGIERTVDHYEVDIVKILDEYPETLSLAKEVRRIREEALSNNAYLLDRLESRCKEIGVNFYYAETSRDVLKYIGDIVGGGKTVVKSKSMVSEEVGLRKYLERLGSEVWETDLGEFILQLADDIPMHIVTPSIHYSKERVAEVFSKRFRRSFDPSDVEGMVRFFSGFMRRKYFESEVGIIGSNSLGVEEPASLLIHNEGNITLTYNTPDKVVVLTDLFKLVPSVKDSMKIALVTSRYAGYRIAGYYDVIYYKSLVERGKDVHLVVLDGGRKKILGDRDFFEAALCIKCGACMYKCTVYQLVGGVFGGPAYPSGIGTVITSFLYGVENLAPSLYTCLLDGRCVEACPIDIDIPSMIISLRARYVSRAFSQRSGRR